MKTIPDHGGIVENIFGFAGCLALIHGYVGLFGEFLELCYGYVGLSCGCVGLCCGVDI